MIKSVQLTIFVIGLGIFCPQYASAQQQVCRFLVDAFNTEREVWGPVHAECPGSIHSAPFGNWGVSSNFGTKQDSHQFDGWCHNSYVCDNYSNCGTHCSDGWYEWNSCTDEAQFSVSNCTLYNAGSCTTQSSTTGTNYYGGYYMDLSASCPYDWDGDGQCDSGGCKDITSLSFGTNYMTIYELDPLDSDELVQTPYFPNTTVPLTCDRYGCYSNISSWVSPTSYDSPTTGRLTTKIATNISWGAFVDPTNYCQELASYDQRYNCY